MKKITKNIFLGLGLFCAIGFAVFIYQTSQDPTQESFTPGNEPAATEENGDDFRIIAFGDSLTAGFGLLESESYPKLLEAKLNDAGYNVEVINSGISGETTTGALERVDFILAQEPDLVMLTIGGNDAFRAIDIDLTRSNIEKIIDALNESLTPENIVLLQISATSNLGVNYKREFDKMYEDIAKEKMVTLLPFVTTEVFLNPKYMLDDGIHPNKLGYEKIVNDYLYDDIADLID